MAQHVDAKQQRLAEQSAESELRAEKLATVDSLLWNTNFLKQMSGPSSTKGTVPALAETMFGVGSSDSFLPR